MTQELKLDYADKRNDDLNDAIADTLTRLINAYGDTPDVRLHIARYTMGYMGVTIKFHIPED